MSYRNLSAVLSITLLAALLSSGLTLKSDSAAVKTIDASTNSVKRDEKAIEHLKQNGSYDSLAKAVTAARYNIEHKGGTASAENPANQMSAQFEESGDLRLSGTAQNWQAVFRLESFGRGANQSAVGSGIWQTKGNRAELRRDELGLTEYFENRADGLEQGFILDAKPAGDENLSLTLQTSGGLRAKASEDGQKIVLSDETGEEILDYDKLKVWDANQTYLTARMTTDETGEIRFEVEDRNAVYPLTIDPTFVQRQRLTANDGAPGDEFGGDVAISGDTAVIGSPRDDVGSDDSQGSAYVFVRTGNVWAQQAKLLANDGASVDLFGTSVAISGDTIIVGAPFDDNGGVDQGSAYIFVRNGANWIPQEKLVAADGAADDKFGGSVSISGETVLIGARSDDVGLNLNEGSAYVFVRNGGAWTQQQKLTANDGGGDDSFGSAVDLSGGTAIVGAPNDNVGANNIQGSAYVFVRSGNVWTQQSKLTATDGAANDRFGFSVVLSVSFSGTFAVIGTPNDDVAGNLDQGSAYVFTRSGAIPSWSQVQKLIANDGSVRDGFGQSVAISSLTPNTIIVGAFVANAGAFVYRGSVSIYQRSNSVWTQQQKFTGSNGELIGNAVDLSGDTLIVGAERSSPNGSFENGSSYIYGLGSASPFDFDGDGKTDIGIFRAAPGEWWLNRSSTGVTFAAQFGVSTDRVTPADFTGDGNADIAFYRPSTGQWFVLRSEDSSFFSFPFGTNGDIAVPADYDGDGKADPAVFRPSTSTWFISKSSGGTTIQQFGQTGDLPVVADYDGDGSSDVAIFRPAGATGAEWWIYRSASNSVVATQFGISSDKPVQGDFTGDGKADIAFFRPTNGNWFVLRSEDSSFFSFPFGTANDIPVPGDYDGDGRQDSAVFRPTTATWFLNRSTTGVAIQQFGLTSDTPIPSAFVP